MKDAFKTKYIGEKFTDEEFDILMNIVVDISTAMSQKVDFTAAHAYYSDEQRDQLKAQMYQGSAELAEKLDELGVDLPFKLPTSVAEFKELIEREGVTVSDVTTLQEQIEATTTFEDLEELINDPNFTSMYIQNIFQNMIGAINSDLT